MGIRISFIGDICINNGYDKLADYGINPFKDLRLSFKKTDYLIGNFESPILTKKGINKNKKLYLYSNEKAVKLLGVLPFNLMTLSNNHLLDTLEEGFYKTKKCLSDLGIESFGAGDFSIGDHHLYSTEIQGKKVTFINTCHQDTNPRTPKSNIKLLIYNIQKMEALVREHAKSSDYVIPILHWGGIMDYSHFPAKYQIKDARTLIDAGAAAIIGHHPHCIQPLDSYKGRPIVYSIGNFCFDDVITHGKLIKVRKTGKSGYICHLDLDQDTSKLKVEEIENKNLNINIRSRKFYHKLIDYQLYMFKIFPFAFKLQKQFLLKIEPKIFYYQMSDKSLLEKLKTFNLRKLKSFFRS